MGIRSRLKSVSSSVRNVFSGGSSSSSQGTIYVKPSESTGSSKQTVVSGSVSSQIPSSSSSSSGGARLSGGGGSSGGGSSGGTVTQTVEPPKTLEPIRAIDYGTKDNERVGGITVQGKNVQRGGSGGGKINVIATDFPQEQARIMVARDVQKRQLTLGEKYELAIAPKREEKYQSYLSEVEARINPEFSAFQTSQFDFYQGLVSSGKMSVPEAEAGFLTAVTGYKRGLFEREGFDVSMEGSNLKLFLPEDISKGIEKDVKKEKSFVSFTQSLSAKEFFPAFGASTSLSIGKFGSSTAGFVLGLGKAGFAKPGKITESFQSGYALGESKVEGALGIKGIPEDLAGFTTANIALFAAPAAKFIAGGVKGGTAFIASWREIGFIQTAKGVIPSSEKLTKLTLKVSPIQPQTARGIKTGQETFQLLGFEEKQIAKGLSRQSIEGKYLGTDISLKQERIILELPKKPAVGYSITETKIPQYAGNLDEVFGKTTYKYSELLDITPQTKYAPQTESRMKWAKISDELGKLGVDKLAVPGRGEKLWTLRETFSSSKEFGTIEVSPKNVIAKFSTREKFVLGDSSFGTGFVRGQTIKANINLNTGLTKVEKFEDLVGFGGKTYGDIGGKADYLALGKRRMSFGVDTSKVLNPADIIKTPFSKTFGEQILGNTLKQSSLPTSPLAIPKPPKPTTLKSPTTSSSNGVSSVLFGVGAGNFGGKYFGDIVSDFSSGFNKGLFSKAVTQREASASGITGQATLGTQLQLPRGYGFETQRADFSLSVQTPSFVLGSSQIGSQIPSLIPRRRQKDVQIPVPSLREFQIPKQDFSPKLIPKTVEISSLRTPTKFKSPAPTRQGFKFPFPFFPSILGLGTRQGKGSGIFGSFNARYSPSLTSRTFNLFGSPSAKALTGDVTPFERRYLLNGKKKKRKR